MALSQRLWKGWVGGAVIVSISLLALPAQATNVGTKGGESGSGCVVDWETDAVLDANLTNMDVEYPGLMVNLKGEPVHYTNGGYIKEVSPLLGHAGLFEANHFFLPNQNQQVWRYPLATDHTIKAGTTITVDLPDGMTNTSFNAMAMSEGTQDINTRMKKWGEPYSKYTWQWFKADKLTAVQTDATANIWTLTFKRDFPANQATIFQFEGDADLSGRYVAKARLRGAYAEGEGSCSYSPKDLPKLPDPPELSTCQMALLGRTVWSPYGNDITTREKFGADWNMSASGWGEVNADGFGLSADAWALDGKTGIMRFYGAVDKDFQGGTYTVAAQQNAKFVAGTIGELKTPGAGQLQGNGYTGAVSEFEPVISEDGSSISFKVDRLPAKSSFSFNVKVEVQREKFEAENPQQLMPMVFTEQMVLSSPMCEGTTHVSQWSGQAPTCESPSVNYTREITKTNYAWDSTKRMWVAADPVVTTETRQVTLPEGTVCAKPGELETPAPSSPPSTLAKQVKKLPLTGASSTLLALSVLTLTGVGATAVMWRRERE